MSLRDRTIVVGVTGGIACYKACELVRELGQSGANVRVVMTAGARNFVTPLTLQTLSGNAVGGDVFSCSEEAEIGHIRLADEADLVCVAPATANVIAKMAHGIADDLLTTVLLATRAPVLVAPAMNVHMWEHPATQENVSTLVRRGVRLVGPASGQLACGHEGPGRLVEPGVVVEEVRCLLGPRDLEGEHVLVSAGPTREAIDPHSLSLQPVDRPHGLRRGPGGEKAGGDGDPGDRPNGSRCAQRHRGDLGDDCGGDGDGGAAGVSKSDGAGDDRGGCGLPSDRAGDTQAQEADERRAQPATGADRGHRQRLALRVLYERLELRRLLDGLSDDPSSGQPVGGGQAIVG